MKPSFPIIFVYNNSVDLIAEESLLNKASVLGVLKGDLNSIAFDSNSGKWLCRLTSEKVKDTFLNRFLAYTFYNPTVNVVPKWEKISEFEIDEFKNELIKLVKKDDDIFTQFINSEEIINRINKSNSFDEIYGLLLKYVFQYNGEEV